MSYWALFVNKDVSKLAEFVALFNNIFFNVKVKIRICFTLHCLFESIVRLIIVNDPQKKKKKNKKRSEQARQIIHSRFRIKHILLWMGGDGERRWWWSSWFTLLHAPWFHSGAGLPLTAQSRSILMQKLQRGTDMGLVICFPYLTGWLVCLFSCDHVWPWLTFALPQSRCFHFLLLTLRSHRVM